MPPRRHSDDKDSEADQESFRRRSPDCTAGGCPWSEDRGVILLEIRNIQKSLERLEADVHATEAENRRLTSRLDVSEGKALIWSIIGSSLAAIVMKFLLDRLAH